MNKRQWKKKQNCDIWEQCPICLLKTKVQSGNGHGRVIWRRKMCFFCYHWLLRTNPIDYYGEPQWTKTYHNPIFDITPTNEIIRYEA